MNNEHQDTRDVRAIAEASIEKRIMEMRSVERRHLRRRIAGHVAALLLFIALFAALFFLLWGMTPP